MNLLIIYDLTFVLVPADVGAVVIREKRHPQDLFLSLLIRDNLLHVLSRLRKITDLYTKVLQGFSNLCVTRYVLIKTVVISVGQRSTVNLVNLAIRIIDY